VAVTVEQLVEALREAEAEVGVPVEVREAGGVNL